MAVFFFLIRAWLNIFVQVREKKRCDHRNDVVINESSLFVIVEVTLFLLLNLEVSHKYPSSSESTDPLHLH